MKKKYGLLLLALLVACGAEQDPGSTNNRNTNGEKVKANNSTQSNNGRITETTSSTSPTTEQTNTNNQTNNQTQSTTVGQTIVETGLKEIFEEVFTDSGCVAGYCHGGAVDGLVIANPEMAITAMVNVDSIRPACDLTKIVVPGKPLESLLWMRVKPEKEGCVNKMPAGLDGLSEEKAKLVYDWIASGAHL